VNEAMRRITAEARRMGGLVDDMLRLARLDQHPRVDLKLVDLSSLSAECAERARIANRAYTWDAHITPDLTTMGDEELLRRAIDNMLANVAAHTPAGTTAVLTAAPGQDIMTIEVSDNGPGIAPGELPKQRSTSHAGCASRSRFPAANGYAPVVVPSRLITLVGGRDWLCQPHQIPDRRSHEQNHMDITLGANAA
jgi:signal transduction histidine kinase